jgi:hypothetical protein
MDDDSEALTVEKIDEMGLARGYRVCIGALRHFHL